ncbi:hypothetical protein BGZ70_009409 [Mortierella alpina]|uniref:BTB domain-containing protein n=1 Tax=Mortierella alpina TaxID=64518 RepID=A0A9P6M0J2_MORAP|nr:hypothetical protein BGZ70_009409 [Mortierella alpina]
MTELAANTHRDSILTESSFFWKIEVEPTRFPNPFCESVTRFFVSEPEPCGQQDYRWKCSFTENMINGKATIDIEIWRVKAPSPQQPQQLQQLQQQESQERLRSQTHLQKRHQDKIDASAVLHRGTYQIEFALSEENSSYETPSPSATLHVFDALFHNVVATFEPDPSTADIWFEFPTPKDDRQPIAFVGAHEQTLSKYKYLSEWIERERREREEQRRQQLEEEWRIHQYLQWGQEQERTSATAQDIVQQSHRGATPVGPRVGHQFEQLAGHTASRSQQRVTPIPQIRLRYQSQSLPVLRITVKDISLEVFQVLLQYLYTGGLSLTDSQRVEVADYWSINPENYHRLSQEEPRTCAQDGGERQVDAPKECAPILLPPLDSPSQGPDAQQQQPQQQAREPHQDQQPKSFTAPLDTWPDPDPYSLPRPDHHPLSPQVFRHHHGGHPRCSWEDLLLAASKLHLKPLQDLAMRALQYRCQMLAIQASLDNSVMAEVAHNGFDETKSDVQLALGDEVLRSLLSLYMTQSSRHEDEVQEWMDARATTPGHEPSNEHGDDETEDEDTAAKVTPRIGRKEEMPVSSLPIVSACVSSPTLLRTRAFQMPVPHPVELSTLSLAPETAQEQIRVIQEHMERSIVVCRSEAASSSSISRQGVKRQRRGSRHDIEMLRASTSSPSTPLPSGQDNDDNGNNNNNSEQLSEEGLLDDPECEHAIMDLCKEIRLRFLRMRDIMEPSRH